MSFCFVQSTANFNDIQMSEYALIPTQACCNGGAKRDVNSPKRRHMMGFKTKLQNERQENIKYNYNHYILYCLTLLVIILQQTRSVNRL